MSDLRRTVWVAGPLVGLLAVLLSPAEAGPVDLGRPVTMRNQGEFTFRQLTYGGVEAVGVHEAGLSETGDAFDGGLRVEFRRDGATTPVGVTAAGRRATRSGPDLTTSPILLDGVRVNLAYHLVPRSSTVRLLVRLGNPTAGRVVLDQVELTSDLGSDVYTTVEATESGDLSMDGFYVDAWAVTSDGDDGVDDVVSHVFCDRAARAVPVYTFRDGDEVAAQFRDVLVPARATRYLMFFARLDRSARKATETMATFTRDRLPRPLTAGLSARVRRAVLNWNL